MVTATTINKSGIILMREAAFQPPRIVLNAVEGWGKTSCGAYTPKPAMLMAGGETGYDTLLGNGLVPQIPATVCETWQQLLDILNNIDQAEEVPYKTLVLDAGGGFEGLCQEHVCKRDFRGIWGDKGFRAYQKGFDHTAMEWTGMLSKLDRIRTKHRIMTIILTHVKIGPFKNPMGGDFDRYVCDIDKRVWSVTHRWADAVLFGTYLTITEESDNKKKGIGGTDRVLYTERRDAYDAKNRYNMPSEIDIPEDPSKIWETIWKHIYKKG